MRNYNDPAVNFGLTMVRDMKQNTRDLGFDFVLKAKAELDPSDQFFAKKHEAVEVQLRRMDLDEYNRLFGEVNPNNL